MKRSHALPLLLLALLFGGWPALQEYVSERTAVEPTGQEIIPPVVMYTTQSCPYCHRARAYFDRHAISYVERDIEASAQNHAEFQALSGVGVPLILVGDKRMQGFSARSFKQLLR
jgi:glutaredoxin